MCDRSIDANTKANSLRINVSRVTTRLGTTTPWNPDETFVKFLEYKWKINAKCKSKCVKFMQQTKRQNHKGNHKGVTTFHHLPLPPVLLWNRITIKDTRRPCENYSSLIISGDPLKPEGGTGETAAPSTPDFCWGWPFTNWQL